MFAFYNAILNEFFGADFCFTVLGTEFKLVILRPQCLNARIIGVHHYAQLT